MKQAHHHIFYYLLLKTSIFVVNFYKNFNKNLTQRLLFGNSDSKNSGRWPSCIMPNHLMPVKIVNEQRSVIFLVTQQ